MRSFCCFRRHPRESSSRRYQEQLEKVKTVYPGTSYICLLNGDTGNIIAQSQQKTHNTEDFARFVLMLRKAAMQFAETLNQMDSHVLHIKGHDKIFSCYGADRTVLAFYSEMNDVEMETFDCAEADKDIESISLELEKLAKESNITALRR